MLSELWRHGVTGPPTFRGQMPRHDAGPLTRPRFLVRARMAPTPDARTEHDHGRGHAAPRSLSTRLAAEDDDERDRRDRLDAVGP